MRVISGVILGYLVFALPAFALFRMTHHDPHAPASIAFEVFSTLYGILFALLAGYLGCALAGRRDLLTAWIIAAIVALGAAASMIAKGISWSPITGLVFMAPAVVLGGWLRLRQAWIRQ